MPDYIPKDDTELASWLANLSVQTTAQAASLALPAADSTTISTLSADFSAALALLTQKKAELALATSAKNAVRKKAIASVRPIVNRIKASAGYTKGTGDSLGILVTSAPFDAASFKPQPVVTVHPGHVSIEFFKTGADGMNIYARVRGATSWTLLGLVTTSPHLDSRPLAQPGTPEVREYQLVGVIKDKEIGAASDIASAVFPG